MEEFISCLIKCNIGFSFHLGFGTLLLPCMLKKKKKKKKEDLCAFTRKQGRESIVYPRCSPSDPKVILWLSSLGQESLWEGGCELAEGKGGVLRVLRRLPTRDAYIPSMDCRF